VLVMVAAASVAAGQTYQVTKLATLGGATARGDAINNLGQVAGHSVTTTGAIHAALWNGSVPTDIDPGVSTASFAQGINNNGQVTGFSHSESANGGTPAFNQAFIYSAAGTIELAAGTQAFGINDAGQVVGVGAYAFLYSNGVMTDLGSLGGGATAYGVNGSGDVVGVSDLFQTCVAACPRHPFLWHAGSMMDLSSVTTGMDVLEAYAVNDSDTAVGWDGLSGEAVLWKNGSTITLGTSTGALAINNAGDVVGWWGTVAALWHAGNLVDLNTVIDPTSPYYQQLNLSNATAINDNGWIVANDGLGTEKLVLDATLDSNAYVLTPQALGFSATTLAFGDQPVGTTSAGKIVKITNIVASALAINSLTTSSGFSETNDCVGNLAAGAGCSISVTFSPVAGGTQSGTVTLTGTVATTMLATSYVIKLSGNGALAATLAASQGTTTVGSPVTLTWTGPIGSTCVAAGGIPGDGWNGAKAQSGTAMVSEQVTQLVTYTITCTVGAQSVTASTQVVYTVMPSKAGGGGGGALDALSLTIFAGLWLLRIRRARPGEGGPYGAQSAMHLV
jgi:probable HAF family extracellular repeat protein